MNISIQIRPTTNHYPCIEFAIAHGHPNHIFEQGGEKWLVLTNNTFVFRFASHSDILPSLLFPPIFRTVSEVLGDLRVEDASAPINTEKERMRILLTNDDSVQHFANKTIIKMRVDRFLIAALIHLAEDPRFSLSNFPQELSDRFNAVISELVPNKDMPKF